MHFSSSYTCQASLASRTLCCRTFGLHHNLLKMRKLPLRWFCLAPTVGNSMREFGSVFIGNSEYSTAANSKGIHAHQQRRKNSLLKFKNLQMKLGVLSLTKSEEGLDTICPSKWTDWKNSCNFWCRILHVTVNGKMILPAFFEISTLWRAIVIRMDVHRKLVFFVQHSDCGWKEQQATFGVKRTHIDCRERDKQTDQNQHKPADFIVACKFICQCFFCTDRVNIFEDFTVMRCTLLSKHFRFIIYVHNPLNSVSGI